MVTNNCSTATWVYRCLEDPYEPNKQWQLWYVLSLPCLWCKPGSGTMHSAWVFAVFQPREGRKPNIHDPILGKEGCLLSLPNCIDFLEGCIYIAHGIFKVMLTSMLRLHWWRKSLAHLPTKDISPWGPSKAATFKKHSKGIAHGIFTMGVGFNNPPPKQ